jgi:hypothetical protein
MRFFYVYILYITLYSKHVSASETEIEAELLLSDKLNDIIDGTGDISPFLSLRGVNANDDGQSGKGVLGEGKQKVCGNISIVIKTL